MVRIANVSTIFCSFLPCTSLSNLFIDCAVDFLSLVSSLYPNCLIIFSNAAIFSSSGSSCTLYTNVFLGFCFPINAATLLFARSINSSINLLASLLSLKYTPSGLLVSSSLKRTSTLSKEIAPLFILFVRIILANRSNSKIASAIGLSTS